MVNRIRLKSWGLETDISGRDKIWEFVATIGTLNQLYFWWNSADEAVIKTHWYSAYMALSSFC